MEVKVIGAACGYHGPYTFYKGIQISPAQQQQLHQQPVTNNNCKSVNSSDENDNDSKDIKLLNGLEANEKAFTANTETVVKATTRKCNIDKPLVLALGECIPVRPWSDSAITCLAELRMVWKDKNEQCVLTGLRLYFLPENTPMGRNSHGEDEVLAISDKVVIRADDLLNWYDDTINWRYGLRATTIHDESKYDAKVKIEKTDDTTEAESVQSKPAIEMESKMLGIRSLKNSHLDFDDIEKEKETCSRTKVAVISFPRYCRYRATLKRLENVGDEWLRTTLVQALGGFVAATPDTRVMFCKETFDYPELETHELLCNHLAPKYKNRPRRGRRKKIRSDSPSAKYDTAGSDSATSEISACSIEKVYSKYSPLYVKPEFKQGTQVLATRPQLRYNPRPARTKGKSTSHGRESGIMRRHGLAHRRRMACSESNSDSNEQSDSSNHDDDDDDENDSLDESEEFTQKLIEFHEKCLDSQIPKVFWIGLKRVNLLSIYQKVKQMGGYDNVIEQKMWKYLFGVDGGYNSISRKKYERVLLPFERYEMEQAKANDDNLRLNSKMSGICTKSTEAGFHMGMLSATSSSPSPSSSLPVTVIVGGTRESASPSIHQPHTTITVHQTTIHPQKMQSPITLQPTAGTSDSMSNMRQDGNGYLRNSCAYSKLISGRGASLRLVRGSKADRSKDWSENRHTYTPAPTSLGSVTVSTMKPTNEKENIPYLTASKTTTITPILGNSNRYPSSISEIIDLVDSDNESSKSPSPTPPSHVTSSGLTFPNMKKRKLDILRQGGLEVTAINNTIGPLNSSSTSKTAHTDSSSNALGSLRSCIDSAPPPFPTPMFQSMCMYTKTSDIFGNPKHLIPAPTSTTNAKCLDLSVQRRSTPDSLEILRLPLATTIRKTHTSMPTVSPMSLGAANLPDPNLQITLVPPTNIHKSQNHKRKSSDSIVNLCGQSPKRNSLTVPSSLTISASPPATMPNLPTIAHDLKIGQLMLQSFFNQNASSENASLSAMSANDQLNATLHDKASSLQLPSALQHLAPPPAPSQSLPGQNPFLPMLDPMYLSSFYQTPNLFFPQTLPQELLQLYKKFPQDLGIIPISKS